MLSSQENSQKIFFRGIHAYIAILNQLWYDGLHLEGGVHLNAVGAHLKGGPQPHKSCRIAI